MTPAQIRKWRFYAEGLIQQAIDILNAIDGDADLEPDGQEEPSANPAEPWFMPAPAGRRAAA